MLLFTLKCWISGLQENWKQVEGMWRGRDRSTGRAWNM